MKALVTLENVAAAAQSLLEAGQNPSLIAVQKKIGGGSYTTVKRYLDQWLAERESPLAMVPMPEAVHQEALGLIQRIWSQALAVDASRIEQETEAAAEEVKTVHGALVTLEAERNAIIEKSEEIKAEHAALVVAVQQLEAELQTRDVQLRQAEKRTRELQSEVNTLRQQVMEHTRLLGELDALRKQVGQQTVLIERLSRPV